MLEMTRRETLLIGAAAAAMGPALSPASAAPADAKPDFLRPPKSPIDNGSQIVIGVVVPATWFQGKNLKAADVDQLDVALALDKGPVGTFSLFPALLSPAWSGQDVTFSTYLKVPVDPKNPPATEHLAVTVTALKGGKPVAADPGQPAALVVTKSDCVPSPIGVLRVTMAPLQFASTDTITLRALAPQPMPLDKDGKPTRFLSTLACTLTTASKARSKPDGTPSPLLSASFAKDNTGLADEVFVSLNLPAAALAGQAAGQFTFLWTYDDGTALQVSTYAPRAPAA